MGCRDPAAGEKAASEIAVATGAEKPIVMHLDLNDELSLETFASTIAAQYPSSVRCHVNNAGFAFKSADPTPFTGQTEPTLRPNFYQTVKLSQLMVPLLEAAEPAGCGRLVNVASMAGRLNQLQPAMQAQFTDPELTLDTLKGLVDHFKSSVQNGTHAAEGFSNSNYGMSKLALIAATKVLAREHPLIRINACCPGYCDTDMTSHKGPRSVTVLSPNPCSRMCINVWSTYKREETVLRPPLPPPHLLTFMLTCAAQY